MNKQELLVGSIKEIAKRDNKGYFALLQKYGVSTSGKSKQKLEKETINLIATNESFSREYIQLLEKNSPTQILTKSSDSARKDIIAAALQGLGMITSTWKDTANSKVEGEKYKADKKYTPLQTALIIGGSIVVLGLVSILVIKATKK